MNKMILISTGMAALALAACSPPVPDSGRGVGFGDYENYRTGQVAAVQTAKPQPTPPVAPVAPATTPAVAPSTPPAPPPDAGTPSISDEQNFQAVSSRETIESDAARIEANRALYTIVEPKALPQRPGSGNLGLVVEFALATNNPVGAPLYNRSGFNAQARYARNCGKYARADQAQAAFLDRGGPQRDPLGLDPDGDGFACGWDPTPFRTARGGVTDPDATYVVVETPGISE